MNSKQRRGSPQAILPDNKYHHSPLSSDVYCNLTGRYRSRSHGSVPPISSSSPPSPVPSSSSVFAPSSTIAPRNAIRRNNSTPAVQTNTSVVLDTPERTKTRVSGRVSMDSFDRARFFRSAVSGAGDVSPSPSPPSTLGRKSRHKKTSSSPSILTSPPLAPTASSSFVFPSTPALSSTSKENDVEPLNLGDAESTTLEPPAQGPSIARSFFGGFSVTTTPAATPPASPALRAAPTKKPTNPSPPPSPSLLARSKAYIPSIPRPSPLMPFRAAQKVVSSVTSVGTGLLPSKEQLGSIPVAGRILKHPVMDSTLTYIASKTTRRGSQGGDARIPPEDVHYRKLNWKLVDQSITLSALAIEKEEHSKHVDDEVGDDAFELYLAAIATLMHALPIETCDPLRREAFESQLRSFLDDNHMEPTNKDKDNNSRDKKLRRSRRRRHRYHRDQATWLIDHYSSTTVHDSKTAPHQPSSPDSRTRRRRRDHRRSSAGLGNTIINTAVESAIRLKQSPIPDVIRTCLRISGAVLAKVDERFHLQEKAWQISKQSLEKAIALDEQYAIHEVVTETFFATVTGLVKAGIAYKETPSYGTTRASLPPSNHAAPPPTSRNRVKPANSGSMLSLPSVLRRRHSIIEEEEEEEVQERRKAYVGQELESDGYDSEDSTDSSSSSSSCFSSEDSSTNGSVSPMGDMDGASLGWGLEGTIDVGPYADQVRQKMDLFMALKGAASLFLGSGGQLANK
ncbi:hypothetical protein BGZ93_006490 [Podila epicladia]|nr:hypothetical protein BGZ92_010957 [Podila epicladia]KAG0099681.1 hypothetical protein BGZ93_006490 [Podila epicladia]